MNCSKLKPLLFICLSGLLASCAQQSVPRQIPSQSLTAEQPDEPGTITADARQLYQQARNLSGEQQQQQLLASARQALAAQDNVLALAISESLKNSQYPVIRQHNLLPLLQAYLATEQQTAAIQLIENTALSQLPTTDKPEFLWLSGLQLSKQQRTIAATKAWLQLESLPDAAQHYPKLWPLLWQQLNSLSPDNQLSLKVGASARTLAWLNLTELSQRYTGQPDMLQQALQEWQRRYPAMPAVDELPEDIRQLLALQPYQPQKIAVLLPFSGNFRPHALAIQFGLLAAAEQQSQTNLLFIDSEQPVDTIIQQLQHEQAEFVIGPLLRAAVDSISQHPYWNWPTLFLNSRNLATVSKPQQFFFALSMEDEATQMVQLFQQKNYQQPVIISATGTVNQRMAQHFSRLWQQAGKTAPRIEQFSAKEELNDLLSKLLETEQSGKRLQSVQTLIGKAVESDPHSRLDIDAIYLIADPVQTRFFKPFVDVSVSQTAPRLPVYASSRSHSITLDRTDQRDLNGVTFTEMPWMLGEQHSQNLREIHQRLFAEQDENLQRLFAMGYDAFRLVGSLKQQQQLPAIVFPGLTGQLSLNPDGSIVRQLSWAGYRNNRLTAIQEP